MAVVKNNFIIFTIISIIFILNNVFVPCKCPYSSNIAGSSSNVDNIIGAEEFTELNIDVDGSVEIDKLTNSEKEKFYRFIYSEFSDTDIVDLKKDNLANFIYSKFNLPHDLCEAIFKDYFSIYKKELDARQYENIMIQLYLIGNSILTQRIKAFQSCDQDHDSYVSEKELNERIRFMKNESKRHFTPGDMLPINDIMKRFDKNKDKKLNFLEFNQYVSKTSTNIL